MTSNSGLLFGATLYRARMSSVERLGVDCCSYFDIGAFRSDAMLTELILIDRFPRTDV